MAIDRFQKRVASVPRLVVIHHHHSQQMDHLLILEDLIVALLLVQGHAVRSLQYHLMATPIEGHSQDVKAHGRSIGEFQDLKRAQSKILSEQGKFIRRYQPFYDPEIKQRLQEKRSRNKRLIKEVEFHINCLSNIPYKYKCIYICVKKVVNGFY
jgi:hypothetical protein